MCLTATTVRLRVYAQVLFKFQNYLHAYINGIVAYILALSYQPVVLCVSHVVVCSRFCIHQTTLTLTLTLLLLVLLIRKIPPSGCRSAALYKIRTRKYGTSCTQRCSYFHHKHTMNDWVHVPQIIFSAELVLLDELAMHITVVYANTFKRTLNAHNR